jgi:hypothetical protein
MNIDYDGLALLVSVMDIESWASSLGGCLDAVQEAVYLGFGDG